MRRRISIVIDEDVWRVLGRLPAGTRSRAINEALLAWVETRRRETFAALQSVDEGALVEHGDVEAWLRGLRGGKRARRRVERAG